MITRLHRSWLTRTIAALSIVASVSPAAGACQPPRTAGAGVGLILSGGGAKGAWEAGVASAVVRRGQRVRLVAGSSSGALSAAMIADGRLDRLETTWRTITRERVYAVRPSVFFAGLLPGWLAVLGIGAARSLFDAAPLRELITASIDFDRVRRSDIRLVVVTTDLRSGTRRIFDNQTVTVDALLAAAALPGVFPPVEMQGALLVDGGVTGRAPVLDALSSGVGLDRALVIMGVMPSEQRAERASLRPTLEAAFELLMTAQIGRDVELARLRHPTIDVQTLTPFAPLALRPQDFEPERTARAFEQGQRDGDSCVDVWQRPAR